MHVFGLGNDYSVTANWNVKIMREFIGNLRQSPIAGQWAIQDVKGSWLHPLQSIVNLNRANGIITVFCPFGWIDTAGITTEFTGKNPRQQSFYSDYKNRMQLIAQQFKNQPDVWIEVWNEPYRWDNSNGYNHSLWLSDMIDMVGNLRDVAGFNNIIVVPGNGQGQLEDAILSEGSNLLKRFSNIVFDLHAYEKWMIGTTESSITARLQALLNMKFALMFGECGVINSSGLMSYSAFLSSVKQLLIPTMAWLWKYSTTDQNALLASASAPNDNNNNNWGTGYKTFMTT
jgi:mannan endo-1,4-beta-mannosidase